MTTLSTFFDMVYVYATETSGHGPFTLGAAVTGFQTAAAAGITNGTPVSYRATDGTNWETAHGVVDVSGSTYTLTRGVDTLKSSNSNSLVSFGSGVTVVIAPLSEDLNMLLSAGAAQSFTASQKSQGRSNLGAAPQNGFFSVNTTGNGNFNLTSGAYVTIPFSTVIEDDQSYFNDSTYRYQPTVAGIYLIGLSIYVVGTAAAGIPAVASIDKNGTGTSRGGLFDFNAGDTQAASTVVAPITFNGSTDYVSFSAYSGLTSPVLESSTPLTFAWGFQIK